MTELPVNPAALVLQHLLVLLKYRLCLYYVDDDDDDDDVDY